MPVTSSPGAPSGSPLPFPPPHVSNSSDSISSNSSTSSESNSSDSSSWCNCTPSDSSNSSDSTSSDSSASCDFTVRDASDSSTSCNSTSDLHPVGSGSGSNVAEAPASPPKPFSRKEIIVKTFFRCISRLREDQRDWSVQHVLKALEEMTSVPMDEIRPIFGRKILRTNSTVADLALNDWFSAGKKCNIPMYVVADFEFSQKLIPVSNDPLPLKFKVVNGDRAGDVLVMEHATGRTTIQDVVQWMSSESANEEEGAVSFFFEDFGKTQYFPLHEKSWAGSWAAPNGRSRFRLRALPPLEATICNFLCTDKAIPYR